MFDIVQHCSTLFDIFCQTKRKDILFFSEAAAKLDTLLAVAEKSEVFIVGNKIRFEEEKPFGMKLDTKQLSSPLSELWIFVLQPLYNSLGETVQRVETLQSLHAQVF